MTENKKLKARDRARMARTGESYTTAHQHVVSGRRSVNAIPGVVAGYDGFTEYAHRPSALASRMLTRPATTSPSRWRAGSAAGSGSCTRSSSTSRSTIRC